MLQIFFVKVAQQTWGRKKETEKNRRERKREKKMQEEWIDIGGKWKFNYNGAVDEILQMLDDYNPDFFLPLKATWVTGVVTRAAQVYIVLCAGRRFDTPVLEYTFQFCSSHSNIILED